MFGSFNRAVSFLSVATVRAQVAGLTAVVFLAGCNDPVTTDFIGLVESGKQREIRSGSRVHEFYKVTYDIDRSETETDPHTAQVTITTKANNVRTWKLAYEHRDGKWRFLRDKSRIFYAGETEGQPLADDDPVWKQFITQELD
jgi:hypothetical protein